MKYISGNPKAKAAKERHTCSWNPQGDKHPDCLGIAAQQQAERERVSACHQGQEAKSGYHEKSGGKQVF